MVLRRVLCAFNKHAPKHSTVHWDGRSYVANCRACGGGIRRLSRGKWSRDRALDT